MARVTAERSARGGGGEEEEEKEQEVYEVEAVVGKRRRRGAAEYLVQWKGYNEQTWEPERNLRCDELIRAFELQHGASSHESGAQASRESDASEESAHEPLGKSRARPFLLVADDWGARASVGLVLRQRERGEPPELDVVTADAQSKRVVLRRCVVEMSVGAALPPTARLVAARVVEDRELAIRFSLLAFLDEGAASSGASSQSTSDGRKRRRTAAADSQRLSPSATASHAALFFFRLSSVAGGEARARLTMLNRVALPPRDEAALAEDLQVALADGPFAVVLSRAAQRVAILGLIHDGDAAAFHVWREGIPVAGDERERGAAQGIASCELVDERAASRVHLLIGLECERSTRSSAQRVWLAHPTDERSAESLLAQAPDAAYMSALASQAGLSAEQVACCCVATKWDAWEDDDALLYGWTRPPPRAAGEGDGSQRVALSPRSLLLVGTAGNSVLVFANGLLLSSLALPATPQDIRVLGYDSEAHQFVVLVRCCNAARSCFLLAFDAVARTEAVEILHAFDHVGAALIGEFSATRPATSALPAQALLLNHLPPPWDRAGDFEQLVRRSVLLHQPSAAAKTTCVRLRLRDGGAGGAAAAAKRARPGPAADAFKYIERTRRVREPRADAADGADPRAGGRAPSEHLARLVASLEARRASGQRALERLAGVTRDKRALSRRLRQLLARARLDGDGQGEREAAGGAARPLSPSLAALRAPPPAGPVLGRLSTVVRASDAATTGAATAGAAAAASASRNASGRGSPAAAAAAAGNAPSLAIALRSVRVAADYPSGAALRVSVVLANCSDRALQAASASVTLAAPPAAARLVSRSPVVAALAGGGGCAAFEVALEMATRAPLAPLEPRAATVWLHWTAARGRRRSLAVARVAISAADDSGGVDGSAPATAAARELLVLSAGSSLPAGLARLRASSAAAPLAPTLVRPTFALAACAAGRGGDPRAAAAAAAALLPRDVYAARNPLRPAHLAALARCLRGLRREIAAVQRRAIPPGDRGEDERGEREDGAPGHGDAAPAPAGDPLAGFVRALRGLQAASDLRVAALLGELRRRRDWHDAWTGGQANSVHFPRAGRGL